MFESKRGTGATAVIENVSDTAFLVAMQRALESERHDALFRDPLARRVAGERGIQILARMPSRELGVWAMAVRTRVIDDLVAEAVAAGADTVLNLGAGLDTRPYRLSLPASLRWVEVDLAPIIELKAAKLAGEVPHCRVERVALDLADVEARQHLLAHVDRRSQRLLVITEGVMPYLTVEAAGALADDLRSMHQVTGWIVDYLSPAALRFRARTRHQRHFANAPFRFAPGDWFGFFASHGWRSAEARYLGEEGRRLGRPAALPLWLRLLVMLRTAFRPGEARALGRFAGYLLMVPDAGAARPQG